MNIKTITTVDGVNTVDFGSAASRFYWFRNIGTTTVYVSGNSDISAGGDGVAELPSGGSVCIETLGGKVYILGEGKVQIHNTGDKFCPFKNAPAQSGGGTIDAYSKTESDAKYAQKTDIPTTLPANGGNADTVGGKVPEKIFYDNGLSTDLNSATQSGCYTTTPDTLNSPLPSWWLVDTMNFGNIFIVQKAHNIGNSTNTMSYIRNYANDVWSEWKEISTTPIKSTAINGTTDENGNMLLWAVDNRKPLFFEHYDAYAIPFLSGDSKIYLSVHDAYTKEKITNAPMTGTLYYVEM